MSYDAQAWARQIRTGCPRDKAVLMNLANRANDEKGCCWPSQKTIADETEFSERAVRKALVSLEEQNLIRREKRFSKTDMIYLLMPTPAGVRPARDSGRSSKKDRHEIPDVPARDSGEQRNEVPVVPEQGAAMDRHEVPPNLQLETTSKQQKERRKKNPRGPAAPWPADAFDKFWNRFPNKVGKGAARQSFAKVEESGNVEFKDLMAGLERYVNKKDDRPWCIPTTFLNQERWEDQPATNPEKTKARPRMAI